jgi:hypothetical protein
MTGVPAGQGNVGPPVRTRSTVRVNMQNDMWCRVASTLVIFNASVFQCIELSAKDI